MFNRDASVPPGAPWPACQKPCLPEGPCCQGCTVAYLTPEQERRPAYALDIGSGWIALEDDAA